MSKLIFPEGHSYIRHSDDPDLGAPIPADWLANFTWTGREDYLAWVADWKAELKRRISAIRAEKRIRSNTAEPIETRCQAHHRRQEYRIDCANLLLLRRIGKLRSAEQRTRNKLAA